MKTVYKDGKFIKMDNIQTGKYEETKDFFKVIYNVEYRDGVYVMEREREEQVNYHCFDYLHRKDKL